MLDPEYYNQLSSDLIIGFGGGVRPIKRAARLLIGWDPYVRPITRAAEDPREIV